MGVIIESLAPTLLVFSFAGFIFFLSLSRFRLGIKDRYDEKKKRQAPMGWEEYFFYTFFIAFASLTDSTAGLYLVGVVLLLFYPLYSPLVLVGYVIILIATIVSFTRFVVHGVRALKISLGKAKVYGATSED